MGNCICTNSARTSDANMLARLIAAFALVGMCQGLVLQPAALNRVTVARSPAACAASPVMFGGAKKAAPKKAVKKAAKKVVKKAVKKVVKKAAKKVVKRAGAKPAVSVTSTGLQSFSSKIFSEENWLVQGVKTLSSLPSSTPRDSNGARFKK